MSNPFATPATTAPATTSAPAATENQAVTSAPASTAPATENQAAPSGNLSAMFASGAASGGEARIQEDLGNAVLVRVTGVNRDMATQHGTTDCVNADWIVLEGPDQGAVRSGIIFPKVIVSGLIRNHDAGQPMTVGVVAQGAAKPGKNAPWLLSPAEDHHLALAGQAAQANGWLPTSA